MNNKGSMTWLWGTLLVLGFIAAFFGTALFMLGLWLAGNGFDFIGVSIMVGSLIFLSGGLAIIKKVYGYSEGYKKLYWLVNSFYLFVAFYIFMLIFVIFDSIWSGRPEFYTTEYIASTVISIIITIFLANISKPKKA